MGEQAQFDLAVVGRDELVPRRRDEGLADLPPRLVAHRNILQIGFGGGQPPGRRRRQRVGCMHAPRRRIDEAGQGVRVGRFQLGELAPVENARGEFIALLGEVFEHARRGRPRARRGLARAGKAHLAEQNVAELLWRAEVEAFAGELEDQRLEPRHVLREFARKAGQDGAVDGNAAPLHAGENLDQRPLQRLIDRAHMLGGKARLQDAPEPQRHVRVLGGIFGRLVDRHPRKADEGAPEPATSPKWIGLWPKYFSLSTSMPWSLRPASST